MNMRQGWLVNILEIFQFTRKLHLSSEKSCTDRLLCFENKLCPYSTIDCDHWPHRSHLVLGSVCISLQSRLVLCLMSTCPILASTFRSEAEWTTACVHGPSLLCVLTLRNVPSIKLPLLPVWPSHLIARRTACKLAGSLWPMADNFRVSRPEARDSALL